MSRTASATKQVRSRREPIGLDGQQQRTVVVFHLAGQAYGIPVKEVREIVPMALLSRPPGLPSVLAGFLNLGGKAIPVLRLDRLFELPDQSLGPYTPLLILNHPDFQAALLVEKVSDILSVPEGAVLPLQDDYSFNDCADGMVLVRDSMILLLSCPRILLEKEQQCLAELQALEQKRLGEFEVMGS